MRSSCVREVEAVFFFFFFFNRAYEPNVELVAAVKATVNVHLSFRPVPPEERYISRIRIYIFREK